MTQSKIDFIKGLRALADWYETASEELVLPTDIMINIFASSKDQFAKKAKLLGAADKLSKGDWFMLRKTFAPELVVDLNIRHETICERVLVGTEVVPEHTVPAQPETVVPEKVIEKYEWRCPESVLKTA